MYMHERFSTRGATRPSRSKSRRHRAPTAVRPYPAAPRPANTKRSNCATAIPPLRRQRGSEGRGERQPDAGSPAHGNERARPDRHRPCPAGRRPHPDQIESRRQRPAGRIARCGTCRGQLPRRAALPLHRRRERTRAARADDEHHQRPVRTPTHRSLSRSS